MKRWIAFVLTTLLLFAATACAPREYTVTIANDYPLANEPEESYPAGDEVVILLDTITEHAYVLRVNGTEIEPFSSDMYYTYFTFTMPKEDVTVTIEDLWISIPRD